MTTFKALLEVKHRSGVCTVLAVAALGVFASVGVGSAFAEPECSGCRPWWHLTSGSRPTVLAPGGVGTVVVMVSNVGDAPVDDEAHPVTVTDTLPAGLVATAVEGSAGGQGYRGEMSCTPIATPTVSCTFAGLEPSNPLGLNSLYPFEDLEVRIAVDVKPGAKSSSETGEDNKARVTGGEVPQVAVSQPLQVGSVPVSFGLERYEVAAEGPGGTSETQAGAHPFQFTTSVALNEGVQSPSKCTPGKFEFYNPGYINPCVEPPALPKDLRFDLPAGLVGNPDAVPQCSEKQFDAFLNGGTNQCPADTVLGVADVTLYTAFLNLDTVPTPIFNLVPSPGEPARFGFNVENVPVTLDTSVRTGRDYGVVVSSNNISELADLMAVQATFWGVPGDQRHDNARGWGCLSGGFYPEGGYPGTCVAQEQQQPPSFLTLPTSCTGELQSPMEADSWKEPANAIPVKPTTPLESLDGCDKLPFSAGIETAPDLQQASTPTGLKVDVHVPQTASLDSNGDAGSDVKDIDVTLPEGVTLNPAGADGLEACSGNPGAAPGTAGNEVGYEGGVPADGTDLFSPTVGSTFCPDASKIAEATIKTPLLPNPLKGSVYLADQNENPFGSLVAMYLVAEDPVSGVLVKLPGEVSLNEATDQISASFLNNPQLPFEDAELHFFGGDRAPLSTPAHCGSYKTEATFTPWSGNAAVHSSSTFNITSGPNGGPCPGAALPFSPSLTAGNTSNSAGGFSPFTMTMSREDGQQNLKAVSLHMPPGLSGILTGVPLCGEAQADAGTCSAASLIGETTVSVGLGSNPYTVTGGKVYLTGGYEGAPFGLSIVNPANAGPFHLGNVIVRAKIEVNPITAALTVTSDSSGPYAIPPNIKGIPLQIKHINVTVNRPGFTFNPTNCNAQSLTGTLTSIEGATATLPVSFQSTNCAALKFAPKFSVSTPGKTNKAIGAGLHVKLSYPAGSFGTQANIARVKVDLPKQLPSQLKTLQKACPAKTFEEGFEKCLKTAPHSKIGEAIVHTPLLPVPLQGPAIFVSHGGEAFPSLTIVLQGYGVTVDLVGSTFIHNGITSTTFKTVPDLPFNTFELTLNQGQYAALNTNLPEKDHGNLCGQKLTMPTAFVAQNGTELKQSTKISVSGCPKAKKAKKKSKGHRKKK